MGSYRVPLSVYRLQFNGGFRFADAERLVPYLRKLGISDIYASPLTRSRLGSSHGYDVIDPTRLDPELGTAEEFDSLSTALKQAGMGLLLDIVPNHMAAVPENPLWRDIQEKGEKSAFWDYFDLDWLAFDGSVDSDAGHRRFFDIGELAGVRVEDEAVFDYTHTLVLRLVKEGRVTGLRVDHVDGLYNPADYLRRLQARIKQALATDGFYIVVEKILAEDETVPADWPVAGTTGYEFADRLNRFFIDDDGMASLDRSYRDFTGERKAFAAIVYQKKKMVLEQLFRREMEALSRRLCQLADRSGIALIDRQALPVLEEATARLPVYRTYITGFEPGQADRRWLETAFSNGDLAGNPAWPLLRRVLTLDFPGSLAAGDRSDWLDFVMRWQQLTGAVMAKGYEDTASYNFSRLISLNDVGGQPDGGGLARSGIHQFNRRRMTGSPDGLNATSTHDTKRSEDVRARISVLSELADEWAGHLHRWQTMNEDKKTILGGMAVPDPETEHFIYQTLLGAWPLHDVEMPEFKERLAGYLVKAMREAKGGTNWLAPDEAYEKAVLSFAAAITDSSEGSRFLTDFLPFQDKIAFYGMLNSLSQVLLKLTSPGVPDIYRGNELWDLSLVDPDNRRPVDFARRQRLLNEIIALDEQDSTTLPRKLLESWPDGRVKMYLTWKALNLCQSYPEVFRGGDYLPLEVSGGLNRNFCVFMRESGGKVVLVVAPRFFSRLMVPGETLPDKDILSGSSVVMPVGRRGTWRDVFTGQEFSTGSDGELLLSGPLSCFPVALLLYNH